VGPDDCQRKGVLTEKNYRLEYTVSVTPGVDYDYSSRELIASQGAYTASWEIQMGLFNGTKSSGYQTGGVGVKMERCANWTDYIYMPNCTQSKGSRAFTRNSSPVMTPLWLGQIQDVSSGIFRLQVPCGSPSIVLQKSSVYTTIPAVPGYNSAPLASVVPGCGDANSG
jgi:hypothetical protein